MEQAVLDFEINITSVVLLAVVCVLLILLVFYLAWSYWQLQEQVQKYQSAPASNRPQEEGLTGLPNRKALIQFIHTMIDIVDKNNQRFALLFLDLDNFRTINDALGPSTGDMLIQLAAERLTTEIADTAMVAHLGADEFAIVLKDCGEGSKEITDFADNVLHVIGKPFVFDEHEIMVSCSIGICTYPDCSDSGEVLLKNADTARYSAKHSGKNIHSFYTKDMSDQALERTLLSADLRKALECDELTLNYQPQIDTMTGLVRGAEALIRWKHPEKGFISPAVFIPMAEESGLIISIGDWIIRTACSDAQRLQQAGFPDLQIAVNLSAYQFNKGDVACAIAEVIWDTGIDPSTLEIELTESVVMGNAEKSLLMLRVLKSMGVEIAVDDFGTGYSSLSQLRQFPIDVLKIDQSFIMGMHADTENEVIVSTIITMAKRLGLKVVAEGVELESDVEFLKQEGCDILQGYHFSKPVPYDEFAAFVQANKEQHQSS